MAILTSDKVSALLTRGTVDGIVTVPDASRFIVGAQVLVGVDPRTRLYKVLGSDNANQIQLAEPSTGLPANLSQWPAGTRVESPGQSLAAGALTVTPSDLSRNRIASGGLLAAPTSASTQATGAGGALAWRVGMPSGGIAVVAGKVVEWASGDITAFSGASLVINGQSIYGAVCVIADPSGGDGILVVTGVAATTGSQARMTDTAVQTALLALRANMTGWVRLGDCLLNRTGDLTLTQSQDNTVRVF